MIAKCFKLALGVALLLPWLCLQAQGQKEVPKDDLYAGFEWQVPNEKWMTPFQDEMPIYFVSRTQNLKEWKNLKSFWNQDAEKTIDPRTGLAVTRPVLKIKVPLGLSQGPAVPAANPMTAARWALGRDLYFDPILSSDGTGFLCFLPRPEIGLHGSRACFDRH